MEDKEASKRLDVAAKQGKYDGWQNALSGFGGARDPQRRMAFTSGDLLSNNFAVIEEMYRHSWIVQRAIDVIPFDATREWVDLDIGDSDEEGLKLIADVNQRMKKVKAQAQIKRALINARLYGGSILVIGADDGQEIIEPLNEENIKSIKTISVLDRWQLTVKKTFSDPMEPNFGEPEIYGINQRNVQGQAPPPHAEIHASRVVAFHGRMIPDRKRIENSGWHDSILVAINDDLRNFGTSLQSGAVLFQDFITKVLKVPGLAELIESENENALQTRIQFAIASASSTGMSLIGEDEEFSKIQTPIQGLDKLMGIFIDVVCGAIGVPKTRLFGQQLGVLAGAEESTRVYYDTVKAFQETELRDKLERVYELFMKDQSGINKGKEPEAWSISFNPLWQQPEKEKAEIRKIMAETDEKNIQSGMITSEEAAESRFTSDGFSVETTLDMESRGEMKTIVEEEPEE